MKKFTTQEVRDLYGQVVMGEISFSQMAEVLNERMSEEMSERMEEMNEPKYKEGNFVINMAGDILILREKVGVSIYDHADLTNYLRLFIRPALASTTRIERHPAEEEKQRILNALAKEGKRWNAEKKCVEDIPKRKFKKGDKVRIKEGVSNKTHRNIRPTFVEEMDELIGKTMTVNNYIDLNNCVKCEGIFWSFHEDWLEPYVEELKEGDLAIFWNLDKWEAFVGKYNGLLDNGSSFPHQDHRGNRWVNAIKFKSVEQFNRLIKGEI